MKKQRSGQTSRWKSPVPSKLRPQSPKTPYLVLCSNSKELPPRVVEVLVELASLLVAEEEEDATLGTRTNSGEWEGDVEVFPRRNPEATGSPYQ